MEQARSPEGPERRHGVRIPFEFWITVVGGEEEPRCLSGNISVSGLYLYTDQTLGPAGTILRLRIATYDRDQEVEVVAHVVRQVMLHDMYRGELVAGIALGFVFRSDEQRHDVEQFVFQVTQLQGDRRGEREMEHNFLAKVDVGGPMAQERGAVVRSMTPDRMMLEAAWSMGVGESIQVEVSLPASRKKEAYSGTVSSCNRLTRPDGQVYYEVHVSFRPIAHPTDLYSAAAVLQALEGEPPEASSSPARAKPLRSVLGEATPVAISGESALVSIYHLRGTLDQMNLTSLLSFLELERRTGVCSIWIRTQRIRLYVRDGQLIDLERDGRAADPYVLLPALMELEQGEFEVAFRPVKREDRLGVSTTGLLLELARPEDESDGKF